MKISIRLYIGLLIVSLSLLIACKSKKKYEDDFYNRKTVDSFKRLPITKPYELVNDGLGWLINFIDTSIIENPTDNLYIDTVKGVIVGHGTRGTTFTYGQRDTVKHMLYFIIDFKRKQELRYVMDSVRFKKKLGEMNINDPYYYNQKEINEIYQEFLETGKLRWYKI